MKIYPKAANPKTQFVGADVLLEQIRRSNLSWGELPQWMRNVAVFACALPPITTANSPTRDGNDSEGKQDQVPLRKSDPP